jgi:hypothetical protein
MRDPVAGLSSLLTSPLLGVCPLGNQLVLYDVTRAFLGRWDYICLPIFGPELFLVTHGSPSRACSHPALRQPASPAL